tara:strand:+ start:739 stop:1077 length:339 start_codon:yes stop_codon:yes gene_type:complete
MCFFGGGARAATPPKTTFDDSPPVVTGMQTGVDNPVDTAKVTEELKIKRMNKEGMSNPGDSLNIAGVTRKSGGLGAKERSERSARLRSGVSRGPMKGGTKAQKAAKARSSKK